MRRFSCVLLLIGFCLSAAAKDVLWQSLESLPEGDRDLAGQTLSEMWGEDQRSWPDWLDVEALYVPIAKDRLLIVRRPLHAACGQYGFAVFGPVTPDLRRDKIGDFCAGTLALIALPDHDWPDLLLTEGRQADADGVWQKVDQRLRWQNGQWWLISQAA